MINHDHTALDGRSLRRAGVSFAQLPFAFKLRYQ